MRVFVWEYCCAACPDAPESLRREGRAMLNAVVEDFTRCPGVTALTLPENLTSSAEAAAFRECSAVSDWTLVIAPESDGILFERCRLVEQAGGRLLGPGSEAVRLTADKLALGRHLAVRGVGTPPCEPLRAGAVPSLAFPLVCKPRDGAGSQATFLVGDEQELRTAVAAARSEGFRGELIVQPFAAGLPASVAFLIGSGGQVALPGAEQRVSADGRFHYLGGRLPLPAELDVRARQLAERAVAAVPGLFGYVGVDLVLGDERDVVIEINPRLTTSYVGLRALANDNLAAAMLSVASGATTPQLTWREGPIEFAAQ